jgi:hypothetical protein
MVGSIRQRRRGHRSMGPVVASACSRTISLNRGARIQPDLQPDAGIPLPVAASHPLEPTGGLLQRDSLRRKRLVQLRDGRANEASGPSRGSARKGTFRRCPPSSPCSHRAPQVRPHCGCEWTTGAMLRMRLMPLQPLGSGRGRRHGMRTMPFRIDRHRVLPCTNDFGPRYRGTADSPVLEPPPSE